MNQELLSPREQEILRHLCALPVRSQQEIALDLGISSRTVRSHISTMLQKCHLPDSRAMVVTEMHRQMQDQGITMLSRSGRKLAVITVKPIIPSGVDDAIIELNLTGKTIFTLSFNVQAILDGLQTE